MKKISLGLLLTIFIYIQIWAVPPHPKKTQGVLNINQKVSQNFGPRSFSKRTLPQHVLVMLCQFTDKQFVSQSQYPDYFPHNMSYFDKYMQNMKDYFLDASSEAFNLNYTIWPTYANLNKPMSYYGDDSIDGERRAELAKDVINALDNEIDYSQYDAFIIFHAGGGQESDIYNTQSSSIWSTFLTKADLRETLDPNNMNYSGIQTQDNTFISEIVISPESERHSDFPEAEDPLLDEYDFSMLGVLIHQFAHQLGLPTLFDNYSANGKSSGIGNFGLMGTAVWNNNGKTPCLPCAWSRYYMGWTEALTIVSNADSLEITYPTDKDTTIAKLYKIPISDKEYFLIENRQHNSRRDSVFVDGHWLEYPLHSFDVLPDSIQDFYPGTNIPLVNLLENTLRGSEWDYFLPYMYYYENGGDYLDPSGLFIWHIDENIIDANFSADFEKNRINGNALHKGVDLEEADGIQHLDFSLPDNYMRGSPRDAFRGDRNNYFGKAINPETNYVSFPNSDSYYGGNRIEIKNISNSANKMYFDVRFDWQINFTAQTTNQSPLVRDFNGIKQIIYFDNNANLYVNADNQNTCYSNTNLNDSLLFAISLSENNSDVLIPLQSTGIARLMNWNGTDYTEKQNFTNFRWANQILSVTDATEYNSMILSAILPLDYIPQSVSEARYSKLVFLDSANQLISELALEDILCSNLSYKKSSGLLYFISRDSEYKYYLNTFNFVNAQILKNEISLIGYPELIDLVQADFNSDNNQEFSLSYKKNAQEFINLICDNQASVLRGFPITFRAKSLSVPAIADYDANGYLDLIFGTENGYQVIAYNGALLNSNFTLNDADSCGVTGGVLPLRSNGKTRFLGVVGHNRIALWDSKGKLEKGYPIAFSEAIKTYPAIYVDNDSVYAYFSAENGHVYRQYLDFISAEDWNNSTLNPWKASYSDLYRSAAWMEALPENQNPVNDLFVSSQCYVYPNPWSNIFNDKITIQAMLSKTGIVKVSVYDISGNLIYRKSDLCNAYILNKNSFVINPNKMSSGVYFVVMETSNKAKRLKFSIEK